MRQQEVVRALREKMGDHEEVYDFREPTPGNSGFGWSQCTDSPTALTDPRRFRDEVLCHPRAEEGFQLDMSALRRSWATVLVLPCGRSAHLELGYAVGDGQFTVVLLDDPMSEPELMYKMCERIAVSVDEVVRVIDDRSREPFSFYTTK